MSNTYISLDSSFPANLSFFFQKKKEKKILGSMSFEINSCVDYRLLHIRVLTRLGSLLELQYIYAKSEDGYMQILRMTTWVRGLVRKLKGKSLLIISLLL